MTEEGTLSTFPFPLHDRWLRYLRDSRCLTLDDIRKRDRRVQYGLHRELRESGHDGPFHIKYVRFCKGAPIVGAVVFELDDLEGEPLFMQCEKENWYFL